VRFISGAPRRYIIINYYISLERDLGKRLRAC
jgi:hypothetical protein